MMKRKRVIPWHRRDRRRINQMLHEIESGSRYRQCFGPLRTKREILRDRRQGFG